MVKPDLIASAAVCSPIKEESFLVLSPERPMALEHTEKAPELTHPASSPAATPVAFAPERPLPSSKRRSREQKRKHHQIPATQIVQLATNPACPQFPWSCITCISPATPQYSKPSSPHPVLLSPAAHSVMSPRIATASLACTLSKFLAKSLDQARPSILRLAVPVK